MICWLREFLRLRLLSRNAGKVLWLRNTHSWKKQDYFGSPKCRSLPPSCTDSVKRFFTPPLAWMSSFVLLNHGKWFYDSFTFYIYTSHIYVNAYLIRMSMLSGVSLHRSRGIRVKTIDETMSRRFFKESI